MFRLVPKKKLHRSKKLKRFTFSLLNHIIKAYKQSAEVNRMTKKEKITKNFALRLDSDTMEAIEKWAADEFRSVNGQIQWILDQALKKSGRLKQQ